MSTENKNRLEVQKILMDSIKECLTAFGIAGWGVSEFANASLQSADKIILVNNIRNERVGWQSRKYDSDIHNVFHRTDELIDEQSWQIHTIAKRNDRTTVADTLAEDMANNLITWFNGFAVDGLRSKGVAPLRIDTENVIVYNDNSDLYQKRAVFTVKLQVPKEVKITQAEMAAVKPKLMPI